MRKNRQRTPLSVYRTKTLEELQQNFAYFFRSVAFENMISFYS